MSEEIVIFKQNAEKALHEFKVAVKSITDQGFSVHVNHDDTLYIFREKIEKVPFGAGFKELIEKETYGELLKPPAAPRPVKIDANGKAIELQ